MTVPFLDLQAGYRELKTEIDTAVARVLDNGRYVLGPETEAFEREFAAYVEADHCVGVGNGLDAVRLALLALGVGPGDEVIVPSHTFIATWLAVSHCGAIVVPVEPDPASLNMDPSRVEAAITSRTRVILPVHLHGRAAALDDILTIARHHGLRVVEDAAQAHGARYRGRRIGAHGDAVAWSFYPGKNLGAMGDGGAVTSDDPAVIDRVRLLGNYGSQLKYRHQVRGFNSRLDPLQAAVLRVKLRHLDAWNARRAQVASIYSRSLADADLQLPVMPADNDPVWHHYVVRSTARDALARALQARGVESLIHYPIPAHRQAAYADCRFGPLPVADTLAAEVLSLPMGPHLSEDQCLQVADAVQSVVGRRSPSPA